MLKNILITVFALIFIHCANGQSKWFTKTGIISFSSVTTIEKIYAINKKVLSVIDVTNNKLEFALLIKGFEFEKALMQEHFNENYLESDKYPKAQFKGSFVTDKLSINSNTNSTQSIPVAGTLTIHGVSNAIKTTAMLQTKAGAVSASCNFKILLTDYGIKIPAINKNNVNNEVQIQINLPNLQIM
jgi:hypothetical protein